jgi:hypothetical protein
MQLLPLIEHVPWIQELPASINLSMMESCVYITFIPSLSRFIPLQCFLYLCRPVDSYCQELLAASHSVHILNALASSCWPVSFVRFHTLLFRLFHSTHTNNANCPALYRSANLQTSSSFAKLNRWICDNPIKKCQSFSLSFSQIGHIIGHGTNRSFNQILISR